MKERTELSKRLRQVREELCGGRNGEFAEKLGVSPQYASAICTGHRAPRRETLERLLEVFPQVRRDGCWRAKARCCRAARLAGRRA